MQNLQTMKWFRRTSFVPLLYLQFLKFLRLFVILHKESWNLFLVRSWSMILATVLYKRLRDWYTSAFLNAVSMYESGAISNHLEIWIHDWKVWFYVVSCRFRKTVQQSLSRWLQKTLAGFWYCGMLTSAENDIILMLFFGSARNVSD